MYMSGQIHDPYAVPAGKDSLLPTEYKNLGRTQKQSGRFEKEYFCALPGIEPRFLRCPTHWLVVVPRRASRTS